MFIEDFDKALSTHNPNKVAFMLEDENPIKKISYGDFYLMVKNLRQQLRQLGLGKDHVLPILAERTPEAFALMISVMLEGAAFTMLNPKLPLSQLKMLIKEIDPIGLVVDSGTLILDQASMEDLTLLKPVVLNTKNISLSQVKMDLSPYPLLNACGTGMNLTHRSGKVCSENAVLVAFTSGSTGRPKGVLIGPNSLKFHIEKQIEWGLCEEDAILFPVTLAHNFGRNLLFSCLFIGASIHLTDHFLYRKWVDIVKRSQINGITSLLQFWTVDNYQPQPGEFLFGDNSHLRFVHIGGQRISQVKAKELRQLLGPNVPLWKSYGQTEKGGTSAFLPDATNPDHGSRLDSVGRAISGVKFYIDKGDNKLAAPNEMGEVLYTGKGAFSGYLGDADLTNLKCKPHPAIKDERVLFSGDVGYLDDAGYLFILGRVDTMFKTHGYRVLPAEIEDALLAIDGITAACAFGVPDSRLGDHVVGAGIETSFELDTTAIKNQLKDLIPRYMIPRHILLIKDIPRNAKGKLARTEIKNMYTQHFDQNPLGN